MKLIDTHCHLNFQAFEKDYIEVIKRSLDNDIKAIINIGTRFDNSKKAVEIAEEFDKVYPKLSEKCGVYAAIGFHPDHLLEIEESQIQNEIKKFKTLVDNPKVVAIGEIGLDNYYFSSGRLPDSKASRKKADTIFEAFLNLAIEVNLPVIIHSRDAEEETLNFLNEYSGKLSKKGAVHCFSGSLGFAKKIIDLGFYIGFTGIITYPKTDELKKVVEEIPLSRILVETDAPFLAPQKYRGKRNEPLYVYEVIKEIANIKKIPLKEVSLVTTNNAKKLFGI